MLTVRLGKSKILQKATAMFQLRAWYLNAGRKRLESDVLATAASTDVQEAALSCMSASGAAKCIRTATGRTVSWKKAVRTRSQGYLERIL